MHTVTRSLLVAACAAVLAAPVAAAGTGAPATASTAPYCGITWGSTAKATSPAQLWTGAVTGVRAGRHTCYDRLVVDLNGAGSTGTGYSLRYVTTVYQEGSGEAVSLRGGAKLQIVVKAPAYDDNGHSTYSPANRTELVSTAGYRTFRQVAFAGSFEGQTTIGLGVRARLPMRAFRLAGPGTGERLVIDVAHFWS